MLVLSQLGVGPYAIIATDLPATYLADQRWTGREVRSSAARLGQSPTRNPSCVRIRYGLGGLIMTWAPGVPGYISQGPLSGAPGTPRDSGVAYGV